MKNKIIYIIAILTIATGFILPAFADEESAAEITSPPLFFHAVNAGYKDDESSQNYDFFELVKTTPEMLDLSLFSIQYFNSSDNLVDEISFAEDSFLQTDSIIFGYDKAPQYVDAPAQYLYSFSTSGLASTAGRLRIMNDDEIIDEVCWGKTECDKSLPKFSTSAEENQTAILCHQDDCDQPYMLEKYYPSINQEAITILEPETNNECVGLQITEIYAYYEENASEQFIEIYNSTDQELLLDQCIIRFKNNDYPLDGFILPHEYKAIYDIPFTKNPSSELTIELLSQTSTIDTAKYSNGQKRGTSNILLDGQ